MTRLHSVTVSHDRLMAMGSSGQFALIDFLNELWGDGWAVEYRADSVTARRVA